MGDYTSRELSASITAGTAKAVGTISVPSVGSKYLIISHGRVSTSGNGVYYHTIGNRTVRSPEKNGGGSINAAIVDAGTSHTVSAYSDDLTCTVYVNYYCIRIQ